VALDQDEHFAVLRRLSEGGFAPADLLPMLRNFYGLTTADVNHDGLFDYLAISIFETVFVYISQQDRSDPQVLEYEPGDDPRSLATGDVNGDGYLAIVVATGSTHALSVLLGNGDGTFLPPEL